MTGAWKIPLAGLLALGLGAGASILFGAEPPSVSTSPPAALDWQVPELAVLDFAALDAQWQETPPWPAPPPPPVAADPAKADEPPPPMPVGIARGRRNFEALFSVQGAGELRIPPGGRLPDGGRVLKVSRLGVEWVDGKGERHEHEMFNAYRVQEEVPANGTPRAGARSDAAKPSRRTR